MHHMEDSNNHFEGKQVGGKRDASFESSRHYGRKDLFKKKKRKKGPKIRECEHGPGGGTSDLLVFWRASDSAPRLFFRRWNFACDLKAFG